MSVTSEITWWCEIAVNTCALKIRLCIIKRENSVTRVQAGVLAYQSCSLVFNTPLGRLWLMPTICGLNWCLGRSGSSRTVCSGWNVELSAARIRPSWEGRLTSTFVFSAVYLFLSDPFPSQARCQLGQWFQHTLCYLLQWLLGKQNFSHGLLLSCFLDPGMRG